MKKTGEASRSPMAVALFRRAGTAEVAIAVDTRPKVQPTKKQKETLKRKPRSGRGFEID